MPDENALGRFLRSRRERSSPQRPDGRRRRTPGLRREELAALAGVSVDYYARLEQGRERRPGPGVVASLSRALGLSADERAHLAALAAPRRGETDPAAPVEVSAGIRQLLETVRPAPAYLLTRVSDVLAMNPEGSAMLPGLDEYPPHQRNTIRYLFRHPLAPELFADWEKSAVDNVAHLRAVSTGFPDDPDLVALVAELRRHGRRFAELWDRYEVAAWTSRVKTFRHPVAGRFSVRSETFTVPETAARLVIYQAEPGGADESALSRLCAEG